MLVSCIFTVLVGYFYLRTWILPPSWTVHVLMGLGQIPIHPHLLYHRDSAIIRSSLQVLVKYKCCVKWCQSQFAWWYQTHQSNVAVKRWPHTFFPEQSWHKCHCLRCYSRINPIISTVVCLSSAILFNCNLVWKWSTTGYWLLWV